MWGTERTELYFIGAMLVLILIGSFVAVYFFVKQYRKEMRAREERRARKEQQIQTKAEVEQ